VDFCKTSYFSSGNVYSTTVLQVVGFSQPREKQDNGLLKNFYTEAHNLQPVEKAVQMLRKFLRRFYKISADTEKAAEIFESCAGVEKAIQRLRKLAHSKELHRCRES
jgi:hypothetical protein